MNNNLTDERKNDFEKDIHTVWQRASNATMITAMGSLASFLLVFLAVFFLTRNRLNATLVIPVALFVSLLFMLVTQIILRMISGRKRRNNHA